MLKKKKSVIMCIMYESIVVFFPSIFLHGIQYLVFMTAKRHRDRFQNFESNNNSMCIVKNKEIDHF